MRRFLLIMMIILPGDESGEEGEGVGGTAALQSAALQSAALQSAALHTFAGFVGLFGLGIGAHGTEQQCRHEAHRLAVANLGGGGGATVDGVWKALRGVKRRCRFCVYYFIKEESISGMGGWGWGGGSQSWV